MFLGNKWHMVTMGGGGGGGDFSSLWGKDYYNQENQEIEKSETWITQNCIQSHPMMSLKCVV